MANVLPLNDQWVANALPFNHQRVANVLPVNLQRVAIESPMNCQCVAIQSQARANINNCRGKNVCIETSPANGAATLAKQLTFV